jgi:nucleotide-binding universal stress UspA family protein
VLVVLLPLFFAYSGVRTQIGLLDSSSAWLMCGLIILVACVGKFGGSAVAARLTGLGWRESSALGVLMNTRGLMELIVLNIGLDLGVISPTLFAMMVVMALVTTFMTSPILNVVYPPEQLALDLIEPAEAVPAAPPVASVGAKPFTVLVCVAHDTSGPGLIALAGALCRTRGDYQIHALHLQSPSDRASVHLLRGKSVTPEDGLASLLDRARRLGVEVNPISFVSADPAEDICGVAQVKASDLVLMGWHKPVLSQTLLGGVVYRVMKEAPSNVGVFFDRGLGQVKRVLVPFVGTPHDYAALSLARRLLDAGAEITLLHVKPEAPPSSASSSTSMRQMASHVFDEPDGGRVHVQVVHHRSPVDVALSESRKDYDLVVVGVGREWGLEQRLVGVHPERLLQESPVSLLIVRGHAAAVAEPARAQVVEAVPAR